MIDVSYGCTRSLGARTYSASGFSSPEDAEMEVYKAAFENGDWVPRLLRKKWWQLWRPKVHNEIEQHFAGGKDAKD